MVRSHTIKNLPLAIEDITVANTIFGPDLGSLKAKTARTIPYLAAQDYVAVPASIHQLHRHVNIGVEIMYVNYLPFLVIVSQRLKYTSSVFIKSKKWSQLVMGRTKFI